MSGIFGKLFKPAAIPPIVEFWCQICDNKLVDCFNHESGSFYQIMGEDVTIGWSVMHIAICSKCKETYNVDGK